ncbi:MAG TPA: hypothetical protein PLJ35_20880 [Anaerolineae bacterium]|nr:hypothetical protein [Anaerolineae bacterium]HOR01277.1 hypothetical protein [Anaerolineae bacterium]HPL28633.1 hypothetical protein [Anaerolineae bacterium]
MFLLLLMLDNPNLMDRILQAWVDLGIRGAHLIESAYCQVAEEAPPSRGPTGLLSFASLLCTGRVCSALLLAPVDSLDMAERAAEAVARIAGPWATRRHATMLALPVAASWGGLISVAGRPSEAVEDILPREPGHPLDVP